MTAFDNQGKPKYTIQGENVYIKITYAQGSTYKATIPNSGEVEDGAAIKITGGIHIEFTNFSAGGGSQGGNPPQPTGVSLQFEGNAWSSYQNLKLYAGLELYVNPDNTGFVALTDLLNQKRQHLMRVEWFAYWMNRLHLYPYMHSWQRRMSM